MSYNNQTVKANSIKISVVTICYNAIDTIEDTMLSVLNQTYPNVEYILIDGGSTDGTVDIIKKYADRLAFWVSEPDKGIYDAMNKGIAAATGDYINFMNAGDKFVNNDILMDIFGNKLQLDTDIIYGNAIFAYPWGKLLIHPRPLSEFKSYDPIFHQSSFTKLSLLKRTPFDISFKIAGDYNFFYKCYVNAKQFLYIDMPMAVFDASEGISSNAISLRLDEGLRIIGQKPGLKFRIKKLRIMIKHSVRLAITKISPTAGEYLQKKMLLSKNRISNAQ